MGPRRALIALLKSAILCGVALGYPNPSPDGCCQPSPSCTNPCQGAMPQMPQQVQSSGCCQPGPSCQNPCQGGMSQTMSMPMQYYTAPAPPPPPPPSPPASPPGCCIPSATCDNPCQMSGQMSGQMQGYSASSFPAGFGGGYGSSNYGGGYMSGQYVGGYSSGGSYGATGGSTGYASTGGSTGGSAPVVFAPYPGEITFKLQQNWDPATYLDHASAGYQILAGNVRNAIQAVLGASTYVTQIYFREGFIPGNPSTQPKVVVHCKVNGGSDSAGILAYSVKADGTLGDGLKVYKDSFNAY